MAEETEQNAGRKPVEVTITFSDGTQAKLQYYALTGLYDENHWYTIMESPSRREAKIKMNNFLADMSNKLIEDIGM